MTSIARGVPYISKQTKILHPVENEGNLRTSRARPGGSIYVNMYFFGGGFQKWGSGPLLPFARCICCRFNRSRILQKMQITLAHIGARAGSRTVSKDEFDSLVRLYLGRCSAYARCQEQAFRNEEAFLEWLARQSGRAPAVAVLFDSRGKQMSSELFAAWLGKRRDDGAQHIVFAIGPADGWSDVGRSSAQQLLSFGQMTLAHSLARVVAAEQIYRAFTILAGHPYHGGH